MASGGFGQIFKSNRPDPGKIPLRKGKNRASRAYPPASKHPGNFLISCG